MKETFGQRLQRLRKEKGLTQEELANEIGISPQAVSKWENDISTPDIFILSQLADILGVSVDELLGKEAPKQEDKSDDEDFVESEVIDDEDKKKGKEKVSIGPNGIHVEDEDGTKVDIGLGGIYVNDPGSGHYYDSKKHSTNVNVKFNGFISNKTETIITTVMWGVALIAFILMGVLWTDQQMGWKTGWIFFFLPPIISSTISAIRKRRFTLFLYPFLVTAVYCLLGFLGSYLGFEGWGFYWFLFITIPAYYLIFGGIDRLFHHIGPDDDLDDDD